jgi:phosphoserine phosphatase
MSASPDLLRYSANENGFRRREDLSPGTEFTDLNQALLDCKGARNVPTLARYEMSQLMSEFGPKTKKAALLDFDGFLTLVGHDPVTGRDQNTVWQEVKTKLNFSPENQALMAQHYATWGRAKDVDAQLDWSNATYGVYRSEGVTQDKMLQVADTIILRPGAKELVTGLQRSGYDIGIVSYGISDLIVPILEREGIADGVSVYADKLVYDSQGVVMGADARMRVVAANKGDYAESFIKQVGAEAAVGGGDSIHDVDMLDAIRNRAKSLGVYFHHDGYTGKKFDYDGLNQVVSNGCAHIASINYADNSIAPVTQFLVRLDQLGSQGQNQP